MALVQPGVDHLRTIGCMMAVLHASYVGEGVYLATGFTITTEMRLDLAVPGGQ